MSSNEKIKILHFEDLEKGREELRTFLGDDSFDFIYNVDEEFLGCLKAPLETDSGKAELENLLGKVLQKEEIPFESISIHKSIIVEKYEEKISNLTEGGSGLQLIELVNLPLKYWIVEKCNETPTEILHSSEENCKIKTKLNRRELPDSLEEEIAKHTGHINRRNIKLRNSSNITKNMEWDISGEKGKVFITCRSNGNYSIYKYEFKVYKESCSHTLYKIEKREAPFSDLAGVVVDMLFVQEERKREVKLEESPWEGVLSLRSNEWKYFTFHNGGMHFINRFYEITGGKIPIIALTYFWRMAGFHQYSVSFDKCNAFFLPKFFRLNLNSDKFKLLKKVFQGIFLGKETKELQNEVRPIIKEIQYERLENKVLTPNFWKSRVRDFKDKDEEIKTVISREYFLFKRNLRIVLKLPDTIFNNHDLYKLHYDWKYIRDEILLNSSNFNELKLFLCFDQDLDCDFSHEKSNELYYNKIPIPYCIELKELNYSPDHAISKAKIRKLLESKLLLIYLATNTFPPVEVGFRAYPYVDKRKFHIHNIMNVKGGYKEVYVNNKGKIHVHKIGEELSEKWEGYSPLFSSSSSKPQKYWIDLREKICKDINGFKLQQGKQNNNFLVSLKEAGYCLNEEVVLPSPPSRQSMYWLNADFVVKC